MAHEMFLAEDFFTKNANVYELIVAIARRARQISEEQRKEMDAYLTQVGMLEDFQEEEESPLDELQALRSEPVLQFEKPTVLALREVMADKLELRRPEPEELEEELSEVEHGLETPHKLELSGEDSDEGPGSLPSKLDLSDDS
ncbi:MAG: DNA-directed RNA polymerase subunit omega [Calditrichaeota bacterium]|nr:DNA-directed RNA polymerase subunit omega [Calditrichota bacterium]